MTADRIRSSLVTAYMVLFFGYLFLPLIIMTAATFNTSRFPTVAPWMGFTLDWFTVLWNDRAMWTALWTSFLIGVGVIVLAVRSGFGGAAAVPPAQQSADGALRRDGLAVADSGRHHRHLDVGVLGSLAGRQGRHLPDRDRPIQLHRGLCDAPVHGSAATLHLTLEEAALDLGASHLQVFRRITLPYLMPAILSAAFIAFLQSFENYNTTIFVRGLDTTLTVYIASKVRTGLTPAVNALSVIMIGLTILGAFVYELARRRELARHESAKRRAVQADMALAGSALVTAWRAPTGAPAARSAERRSRPTSTSLITRALAGLPVTPHQSTTVMPQRPSHGLDLHVDVPALEQLGLQQPGDDAGIVQRRADACRISSRVEAFEEIEQAGHGRPAAAGRARESPRSARGRLSALWVTSSGIITIGTPRANTSARPRGRHRC